MTDAEDALEEHVYCGKPSDPVDLAIESAWIKNERGFYKPATVRAGFEHGFRAGAAQERKRFSYTISRIKSSCGHPNPAEACRVILEIAENWE